MLGLVLFPVAPYVGVISSVGVLEDGGVSSVSPSELPPVLWLG